MKKLLFFVVVCAGLHYLFTQVIDFSSPPEKLAKRIKSMDIASFELQWDTGNEDEHNLVVVCEGVDKAVIAAIQKAMDEIILHSKSDLSFIFMNPLGALILRGNDGSEERIDIAPCSFFVGRQRVANTAFYSPALSAIIKDIYEHLSDRGSLIMTEKLFETLAKGGNIQYAIDPKAREEFIRRISKAVER